MLRDMLPMPRVPRQALTVGESESDEHQHPFSHVGWRVRCHVQAQHQAQGDENHQVIPDKMTNMTITMLVIFMGKALEGLFLVLPEKGVEETHVGARRGGDHRNGQRRINLLQMHLHPLLAEGE